MKIDVYCGERWYWRSSWGNYPLFKVLRSESGKKIGFSVGPILVWDGS